MKRKMTSKERVLTAFARQEPDRVPINYCANGGIDRRLQEHFGIKDKWVGEVLGPQRGLRISNPTGCKHVLEPREINKSGFHDMTRKPLQHACAGSLGGLIAGDWW